MPDTPTDNYQLILEKVPDEKQPETALFLSGCFSLPPASTRGIAASGPIALISGMPKGQAEAVMQEIEPSIPPGVEMRIALEEEQARISRLQWPRPPRIYGSPLDEFEEPDGPESVDAKCPICGGVLHITQDGGEVRLAPAAPDKRRRGDTVIQPRPPLPSSDKDPLFSGVKPVAQETTKYASIRSLQAGDTGFWMDHTHSIFAQPAESEQAPPRRPGETSSGRSKSGSRPGAGLAAFMKPGSYAVVLGRTRDAQVIKMVSEIMGIGEGEARERCQELGLCVARDISLDEAQNLLARFRNFGARARIVRPS